MSAQADDLVVRLEAIAEELGDLSISVLRDAIESGNPDAAAFEKRIARARRSVDKAAVILAGLDGETD